jgi:hypothetical protein
LDRNDNAATGTAVAVEVKYTLPPKPMRGFRQAYDDLHCRSGYVMYPGEEEYPLGKGVSTHL